MVLAANKTIQMKKFISNMFSGGSEISSKRVNGTIAYLACTVAICVWYSEHIPLLLASATLLLGASLLEKK